LSSTRRCAMTVPVWWSNAANRCTCRHPGPTAPRKVLPSTATAPAPHAADVDCRLASCSAESSPGELPDRSQRPSARHQRRGRDRHQRHERVPHPSPLARIGQDRQPLQQPPRPADRLVRHAHRSTSFPAVTTGRFYQPRTPNHHPAETLTKELPPNSNSAGALDPAPLRYVGVHPIDSSPVEGPSSSAHSGRNSGGWTIQPALRAGRAFAHLRKSVCGYTALPSFQLLGHLQTDPTRCVGGRPKASSKSTRLYAIPLTTGRPWGWPVVQAAGGGGGELAVGPADEGVQLPPVVQAIVADDAPSGSASASSASPSACSEPPPGPPHGDPPPQPDRRDQLPRAAEAEFGDSR
jgi:hypothetical protein